MSDYFYIVSELNGFVLEIDGLDVLNKPQHGGPNQLWKWDGCQLVSKFNDLVLDVHRKNKAPGTKCIGWTSKNGLNQKWRFEEGLLKSHLNGLVLDVKDKSLEAGAKVIMWNPPEMGKEEEGKNQKWFFVPEDAWNDFMEVQANLNALTIAQFWKNMADNYLHVIIGCNLNEYEGIVDNARESLSSCTPQLDKIAKGTGIAKAVGGGTTVAGGAMALAGLILSPVTAGASLALTLAGVVTTIAGSATTFTGDVIKHFKDKDKGKEVQEATESAFQTTLRLQGFLNEYIKKLKEAAEFLKTPEGKAIASDAYNICEVVRDDGTIARNVLTIGNVVVNGVKHVRNAKRIKSLVDFIQADYYALNGARVGLSTNAAAPGFTIPVLGKTIVAAGTTGAKVLSGSFAVAGMALGIWDIYAGAKQITNGSKLAKEFRQTSETLKTESSKLIKLYKELK